MSEYQFEMSFKNDILKFRKWKVKDKIKFLEGTSENDKQKIRDSLVYDCLENKNIVLNDIEYKYVLTNIRKQTIGDNIIYNIECDNCKNTYEYNAHINDFVKAHYKEIKKIKTNNHNIVFGNIANKDFYNNIIDNCKNSHEISYMDMLLRIVKIDSNDAFTFEQLIEIFNDIDIDEAEEIIKEYEEARFKLDLTNTIECPHCMQQDTFEFDFFPDFFPDSWFK